MQTHRVLPKQAKAVKSDLKVLTDRAASSNLLDLNDTGKPVAALQRQLAGTGLYKGKISGTFDVATQAALQAFQTEKKLPVTGALNLATLKALKTTNLFVKDGFKSDAAKIGQNGSDIRTVEARLAKLGFLALDEVDGVFDQQTQKAVSSYSNADPQLKDGQTRIGAKLNAELRNASKNFDHAPRRARDITGKKGLARHEQLDKMVSAAVAKEAAAGGIGRGAKGRAVNWIEQHLKKAGFEVGAADKTYGGRTEAAVRAFQKNSKLPVTGRVDAKTWAKLKGSLFGAASATAPAQREGEKSGAVLRTEKLLKKLGYNVGKVDGFYSSSTEAAVKRFQKKYAKKFNLQVSGDVGRGTAKAIDRVVKSLSTKKPPVVWKPSPNFNSRGGRDIDSIVIHHTASNSTAGDLATLRSSAAQVSAHYLVGRDGKIYQLVKDGMRAWHAGDSALRGDPTDMNARSIGIEITNDGSGKTPFTPAQYRALERLVPWLAKTYKVPMKNLVGHKDIAVPKGRKSDPASNFNWERIRRATRKAIS